MACKPGEIEIIHEGGNSAGCWSDIPTYFDTYTKYINGERVLDMVDVGEYDIEQLYTVLYGALEPGEYYNRKDLNGDGVTDFYKASVVDGEEQILTVYGRDDKFQNYELSYDEWQYTSFIDEFEEILTSENPSSAAQELFERYENAGIADNTLIQNWFSFTNPNQIMDRAILGDGDIGVTVDVCTTPGQTNCVDPKAIKDLWEDFGRHIRVIFKGLGIPGLPEWLPLPGIMRLPTIGEIWDRVTGPFTDAAREQLKDCMSKDDDGDGVNNTASYCMENRDIIGIITEGLEDGASEIIDATTEAVGGIVDKALETLDCVTDPAACAEKIKDTIEGVLGGADPTQPGLPPWMRAIIIGSQYGDEILKELEKIFDSDIDGDGTIGITPTQEYCADGVTIKEDSAGTNCPEYVPDYGMCDDGLTKKEDAEGTNCPGPEPVVNENDPCDLENEGTGTYQYVGDELQCIPNPPEFGFCQDGVTEKEDAEGTNCDEYEGPDDGTYDPVCTEPRPTGTLTFALQDQQLAWDQKCRATHCESGVPISEDPDCYGPPPGQTCDNNAVNAPDCTQCENGESPDQHIDGDCNKDLKDIDGTDGQCPADSERAGQNPLYDGRDTNKSGFFTSSNGITYTYDPCNPSLGFSIVGQDVNVCEDQNNVNYGNIVQQPEEPCGDCKPGFDKPEGYDTCVSIVDVLCNDANVSGNYEECKTEEPPEETNCAQQGKVTNEDGSCGGCDTEKGYVLSELTGRCYIPQEGDCTDDADGNPRVRDGFGRCVTIGSECRAESFGGQDCRDPETNAYQFGVIDADGSCVCPGDIVEPPEEECYNGATDYPDCVTCPSGQRINPETDQCEEVDCTDPANALFCGWVECDDGTMAPTLGDCEQETPCSDPEYAAANPLECGWVECPDGSFKETREDCEETPQECANGATDFPACTTCPEGQSMDAEGNCVTTGEPPQPPPETGGGGGGGMLGGGSFTPFLAGISYTPQAVPEPPAPAQKDYMAELDNIIKRSLFEGMA